MPKEVSGIPDRFLAIVSTPIGNLDDMTFRAVEILRKSDIIAAEDTRRAHHLLAKFDIKKRLISYHSFNEHQATERILNLYLDGQNIALISDAGTPSISDPGFLIVREAIRKGIEPLVIPGVSSLTFAITASGLPVNEFKFHGFLPVKQGRRSSALQEIAREDMTSFVFESPHRIAKLLGEINEIIGPETQVAIIREATKIHEEVIRGTTSEILGATENRSWKGEIVVAIRPQPASATQP